MKIRLLMLVFLVAGLIGAFIGTLWMLGCVIFAPNGTRAWGIAKAFDRLFNAVSGGDGRQTISTRAGLNREDVFWACLLCRFLDWLQADHCEDAVKNNQ